MRLQRLYQYQIIVHSIIVLGVGTSDLFGQEAAPIIKPAPYDAFPDADSAEMGTAPLRSAVRLSPLRIKGVVPEAGLSAQQQQWLKDNCVFGMPKSNASDLGPVVKIYREGYVLGHSSLSRIPYWVCEHSTAQEIVGNADRENSRFRPDPVLEGKPRSELSDYRGSGFDRGHMAPAGDFKFSQQVMDESFFLSNMVPQYGRTFNQGIWAELEDLVREWVKKRGECWIITGPMFYDPLEEDPATADGMVHYETVGSNDVAVPTHLYKIVVAKKDSGWQAIAFVFENRRYGQPYRIELHRATIRWIEDRTGLDFFPEATTNPGLASAWEEIEIRKSAMWDVE